MLNKKWAALSVVLVAASALLLSQGGDPEPITKVGIHGIRPNEIVQFVQNAHNGGTRFAVVKGVDDMGFLYQVHAIDPEIIIVGRVHSGDEGAWGTWDPNQDMREYAHTIMGHIFRKIESDPGLQDIVDYWEPVNEPLGGGTPAWVYARLAELMIHCMDVADEAGLKLLLFSFNNGTPEWSDYEAIVETGVFAQAKAGGHGLAVHEGVYGDDPVDKWFPGGLPGAPYIPNVGALNMRYRNLYYLLEQRGEVVPLVITEHYPGGDYNDPVDIVSRISWYDNQCNQDDYCLGFTPFTLGAFAQWVDEDLEQVYPAIVEYMIELGTEEPIELKERVYLPIIH